MSCTYCITQIILGVCTGHAYECAATREPREHVSLATKCGEH